MFRIATIALFAAFTGCRAIAASDVMPAKWFHMGNADANTATPAFSDGTFALHGDDKKGSAFWSLFDPIALSSEKPVTLSCRIATPGDLPTNSTAQIRIGLYGVVAGTKPDATKHKDLRGFIVMGGSAKNMWRIELAEHPSDAGPLIYQAGMTNRAMAQAESNGGRGAESRVVITMTKKASGKILLEGFWGDVPFSFEIAPFAGDYTHVRAVAFMRGGNSGTDALTVKNVRIRSE